MGQTGGLAGHYISSGNADGRRGSWRLEVGGWRLGQFRNIRVAIVGWQSNWQ